MNGVIHRHLLISSKYGIFMVLGVLLCLYLSYHLLHGNRSLIRLIQLENQIKLSDAELSSKVANRKAVEKKVVMLRSNSVDVDLLEERIHKVLGYAANDDYIISMR